MSEKSNPSIVSPPRALGRYKMPSDRNSHTHKFTIVGGDKRYVLNDKGELVKEIIDVDGYVTAGMYPDGKLGEIFLTIGKHGEHLRVYDLLMISVSIGLQYGIPLEEYLRKFENQQFEPAGITKNPEITIAKSIPDYLARWLRGRFPDNDEIEVQPEVAATVDDEYGEEDDDDGPGRHSEQVES